MPEQTKIPPKRETDVDDIGDTTAGGIPTGTGVSGNEVPPLASPVSADIEDEDEDEVEEEGV